MRIASAGVATLVLLVGVACSAAPSATPIDREAAIAAVLAQDPLFAGIPARDPELIGQAAWTETSEGTDGWHIVVRIGWGDCPSGCIHEHRWTFAVTKTGAVRLADETGDPVPTAVGVDGMVLAGPTCPVVTDPPDPSCADRPVADAELVVTTPDGVEVTRTTSDEAGSFEVRLAPGPYRLVPQPVEGLMGTAESVEFSVSWDGGRTELVVAYDTGIR
jgi:hypothetical protein